MGTRCGQIEKRVSSLDIETFGERLTRLLEGKHLSIRKGAEVAGVPASTLQEWRGGASPTDFGAVRNLAKHFGVSMAYLLTGEEDEPHKAMPDIADVFLRGEDVFNGFLEVRIKRLIPKRLPNEGD